MGAAGLQVGDSFDEVRVKPIVQGRALRNWLTRDTGLQCLDPLLEFLELLIVQMGQSLQSEEPLCCAAAS